MLALLMTIGFAIKAEAKAIYTVNVAIAPGQTRDCYIFMNAPYDNFVSFQMDLKLPEGLSLNTDNCLLTDRVLDQEQMLFAGNVGGNTYRIVSTSFNIIPITKADGTLVKLSLTADANYNGGTVTLTNMIFFTDNCASVRAASDSFTVKAAKKIKGDVDFDGQVNVTDAMYVIDYVLDSRKLYSSMLDVNGDGIIDVTDAMIIVESILN